MIYTYVPDVYSTAIFTVETLEGMRLMYGDDPMSWQVSQIIIEEKHSWGDFSLNPDWKRVPALMDWANANPPQDAGRNALAEARAEHMRRMKSWAAGIKREDRRRFEELKRDVFSLGPIGRTIG